LSLGTAGFVVVKTVVTLLGGAFLCLHKNWALGRACLWFALAGYGALTAWHVYGQTSALRSQHARFGRANPRPAQPAWGPGLRMSQIATPTKNTGIARNCDHDR